MPEKRDPGYTHMWYNSRKTLCGLDAPFHRVSKNWNNVNCPDCKKTFR